MSHGRAKPLRILLIDDSPLIRLGLKAALEDQPELLIVGEAGSVETGLTAVEKLRPDVVLLDLRLPDRPGTEACREITRRHPAIRVLMLTSSTQERNVQEAITAGAHGYLLKDNDSAALVHAIRQVSAGRSVLDPSLADQVMSLVKTPSGTSATERIKTLSAQEKKVVALLADGLTNKEIGDKLGLTEKTVKNYLATVFDKLGITRRTQAAALHIESQHG